VGELNGHVPRATPQEGPASRVSS